MSPATDPTAGRAGATGEAGVEQAIADAWRAHWSRLIGLLIGQFQRPDLAEDAVSDAFESATRHWPTAGVPDSPGAWLLTAARHKVLDRLRTEAVQRRKEPLMVVDDEMRAAAAAAVDPGAHVADEQLRLVFACCHPAVAADDRVALTLRFVVGLPTAEIARLMLVQESAMAARLTRAKKRLASSGIPFATPEPEQLDERLDTVATVVYLAFTSAYQPGADAEPLRVDLGDETIRLLRELDRLLPGRPVVRSLLALLLLQHSRRDARLDDEGRLVLLPDQDRSLWHTDEIAEALALLRDPSERPAHPARHGAPESVDPGAGRPGQRPADPLRSTPPTPTDPAEPGSPSPSGAAALPDRTTALAREYRLQALIAAEHATAPSSDRTRWPVIAALYAELEELTASPVVRLARAVAVAEAYGPEHGLVLLDGLETVLPRHHRVPAVRAELLLRTGDRAAAAAELERALTLVTNETEATHLRTRLRTTRPTTP